MFSDILTMGMAFHIFGLMKKNAEKSFVPHRNYREWLRSELTERTQRNPQYSQRAFAKDLGIYPGQLNEILNEKKGLSPQKALRVSAGLGLNSIESKYFCDLVVMSDARSQDARLAVEQRLKKIQSRRPLQFLQHDQFKLMADWYHLAILELLELNETFDRPKTVSKALGITIDQAKDGLSRLERLGMIEATDGVYRSLGIQACMPETVSSESIKSFHRQVLEHAGQALDRHTPERGEFNTTFLAIDARRIGEAKTMIKDFWKEMAHKLQVDNTKDSLYCLSIQFFNLRR